DFTDKEMNMRLLLKHDGSYKRTVRELGDMLLLPSWLHVTRLALGGADKAGAWWRRQVWRLVVLHKSGAWRRWQGWCLAVLARLVLGGAGKAGCLVVLHKASMKVGRGEVVVGVRTADLWGVSRFWG
ncbi:unnamed protein product, partial [Closterium sp. NIES-54]